MKAFKNQSISLVKLDPETNQLCVPSQAIKFLSSLTNPIAVITIAGLYRTGKSFLVNKLLPSGYGVQPQSAFKVGVTTQSMTKGLNILATPITLRCPETGQDIDYLLIDSEGIGSCEQSIKYDTDLLILIFLISSTVVYNSMGAIDQLSLQQLQVVLQLKKCVEKTEHSYDNCSYKYVSPPPRFLWVLRDFSLQLIDKTGRELTPDQYLEQCLQQSSNSSNQEIRKKNQIRKAIKQSLGERHCYTLVRPTIKQEDLQHLANAKQPSKIRTQFIGQLESMKQELFRGSSSDIKVINNQPITGKLFSRILSEYLAIINNNQLPKVNDVWNSVIKISDQEYFEEAITQLRREIKNINLPISKQQLKMKINEIQNRVYRSLEKNIANQNQFKVYHKQFLKIVQKLNKQLKDKNDQLRKNNLMDQLHLFVKQNVSYDAIKPHNISQVMKQLIERIRIKINGEEEGYEYLISIINDVFFIVEQKSSKVDRQYSQIKLQYEKLSLEKNNLDLTLINLKRQYHDSLKAIARLQEGQADLDKNYYMNKNKISAYESKILKLEAEQKEEKQTHDKMMKQIQEKLKSKIQDLTIQNKKLKSQQELLRQELSSNKEKFHQQELRLKKQMIFQQKIQQSYEKFNQERASLRKQIQTYKKQIGNLNDKYSQLKQIYQKQVEKQRQIQQNHERKQQNLMKQFQNLKKCMKETRASYQQTFQTMQSSDQVLREVTNSTAKKQKCQTPGKQVKVQNQQQLNNVINNNVSKKYYQSQIQKLHEDYRLQISKLQEQITNLQKQLTKQHSSKQMYFMEAKQYKQKCMKLESDIISANAKFNQVLKHIQDVKQQERALYEQSIVRLLNNIQKKERDSVSSSGVETRMSGASTSYSRRKQRHAQSIRDSLSFGNAFRSD